MHDVVNRKHAGQRIPVESATCLICGENAYAPVAKGTDYDYCTTDEEFVFVRCRNCGHVYLNPRPAVESASMIYPPTYYTISGAHRSGALSLLGRVKDVVVTRRMRALLQDIPPGARVLEVGCGDGSLLLAIRRIRADLDLTGLDLKIEERRRRTLHEQRIASLEAFLEDVVFERDYDLIIMNQLVEHLWDVKGCLAKLNLALANRGRLSIATPNLDGWDYRFFREGSWGGYYFPRHLNLFSGSALKHVLGDCGFGVVAHQPLVAPLVWIGTLRAVWKRRGWKGASFLKDSNLPLLAAFALLDRVMIALGFWTSNQQVVAEKSSVPRP